VNYGDCAAETARRQPAGRQRYDAAVGFVAFFFAPPPAIWVTCTTVTSPAGGICIKIGDAELAENHADGLALWAGALYVAGAGRGSGNWLRSRCPAFGRLRAESFGKFREGFFEDGFG